MSKISTCLWFDNQAEEAAKFYTAIFKDAEITSTQIYDDATAKAANMPVGTVLTVNFTLNGSEFTALNGGPLFKFSEAISFVIECKDQEEIDYYWGKLSAQPEAEQCGWLKDKFGVSWQVVPEKMDELINSPAATAAMMKMKKINIAELQAAARKA